MAVEYQLIAFIFLLVVFAALFVQMQLKKETTRIEIVNKDGKSIYVDVELADNLAKRMKGLMFRKSIGENEGMLFVFDYESQHSFWMMNTSIPLDAIHFDSNGTVVDVIRMDVCKSIANCTKTYAPKAPSRYVLEVNQNFSMKNGIEAGNSKLATTNIQ